MWRALEGWRAACNPCPGLLIKIAIAHNHHDGHDDDDHNHGERILCITWVNNSLLICGKTFERQKSHQDLIGLIKSLFVSSRIRVRVGRTKQEGLSDRGLICIQGAPLLMHHRDGVISSPFFTPAAQNTSPNIDCQRLDSLLGSHALNCIC